MDELRLGDIIDDYCVKCRRMTKIRDRFDCRRPGRNVRCRSCYHDHTYLHEQIPPSKKDLKKMELFNAVLAGAGGAPAPEGEETATEAANSDEAPAAPEEKKPRGRAKKP